MTGSEDAKAPTPAGTGLGRRMRVLADSYHATLRYALRPASAEEFSAAFPSVPPMLLDALYNGYRQALHGARVNAEAEFDTICQERSVADRLHALEQACEEQGVLNDGDRPYADPSPAAVMASKRVLFSALEVEAAKRREELEQLCSERAAAEAELALSRAAVVARLETLRGLARARPALEEPVESWVSRKAGGKVAAGGERSA